MSGRHSSAGSDAFGAGGVIGHAERAALPSAAKGALGLLAAVAVGGLPFARLPGPVVPGVTAAFCAVLFVTEFATAMLLLVRFQGERRPWLALLVCAYVFSALMAVGYLLAFPGALQPGEPLIGDGQAASWLFVGWTVGMPVAAIAAGLIEMRRPDHVLEPQVAARIAAAGIGLTIAIVGLFTALVVVTPALPALVVGGRWTGLFMIVHVSSTVFMLVGVAVILAGPGRRSDLFAWFSVTLMAMALANLFAAVGGERYSVGWTVARIAYALGAGVLFGFFLWLFSRQQRLLASAQERLEAEVAARTGELRHMIGERDTLLGEVYHRVNNNLQVLRSMLLLERRNLANGGESAALARMDRRTLSIGVVHRRAMETRLTDDIDVAAVIEELGARLERLMASDGQETRIEVRAATARMGLDLAVPLGLLIQELVACAAQHIAAGERDRTILITFEQAGGVRTLCVSHPRTTGVADPDSLENLIIASLISQIGGREQFGSGDVSGRVVRF